MQFSIKYDKPVTSSREYSKIDERRLFEILKAPKLKKDWNASSNGHTLPACWKKTFNPLLLDPNNQLQLNNNSFRDTLKRYRKKRELLVEDSELPVGWKLLAQDLKTQNSKFNANDFDFTLFEKKVVLYTLYFFIFLLIINYVFPIFSYLKKDYLRSWWRRKMCRLFGLGPATRTKKNIQRQP